MGGNPEQTEPGALRMLAALAADFPERASVHLAAPSTGWQNAKTYYVRHTGRSALVVGLAAAARARCGRRPTRPVS